MIVVYQRPQFFDIHVFHCGVRLQIVTIEVDEVSVLAFFVQDKVGNSSETNSCKSALIAIRLKDLAYLLDSKFIIVEAASCFIYVVQRAV